MRKLLLLFVPICFVQIAFSQPSGLLNETFRLKHVRVGDMYYTPNGENPELIINESSGIFQIQTNGIENTLYGSATFNGNGLTFYPEEVTNEDCSNSNCYYEDLYFYEIWTNNFMETKSLTYQYSENNGIKKLKIYDDANNLAFFSTTPNPVINPLLIQTWYLFMTEVDLEDPVFYDGIDSPQITINPDMTYTGIDGCALISGDFIVVESSEFWDFYLQSRNYASDESNCTDEFPVYAMGELESDIELGSTVYQESDGMDYFVYEFYPGFISHFRNQRLSTSQNNLINLSICPNPVQDRLLIEPQIDNFVSVSITDINGRTVISLENGSLREMDVSGLKSGMYFLRIESNSGNITKKFLKY